MRWNIVDRALCALYVCLGLFGQPASAEELLPSGIYRFVAEQPDRAQYAEPEKGRDKLITHRFEHVLPPQAHITYAVVARGGDPASNKILFLPAPDYPLAGPIAEAPELVGYPDYLCIAYTLKSSDDANGFCRGDSYFAVRNSGFAFSLLDVNKVDRVEPRPGQWLSHESLTHRLDVFSLLTPKAYQDVLFLSRSVTAYTQPVDGAEGVRMDEQRFVAIRATHPEWYEIDLIASDGEITPLWLRRDALIDDLWVPQRVKSAQFEFIVAVKQADDSWSPLALRVIERKSSKVLQTVYGLQGLDFAQGPAEDMLKLVDANFDGLPDIRMPRFSGGAGPNSTENIILFNPRTGLFEYDEQLSELPQLFIDAKHRNIVSSQRGSCCSHMSETYRYIGGKLTMVADWNESLTTDGKWLETTVGKLVRGKMIYRTTRRKLPAGY